MVTSPAVDRGATTESGPAVGLSPATLLRFRRQFVLGPDLLPSFPAWQRIRVAGTFWLHAHPDLAITQCRLGEVELTLLGYALDPEHPQWDDARILEQLCSTVAAASDACAATGPLGGRWVLLVRVRDELILFTDPGGLRQVVYVMGALPRPWVASQPEVLKDILPLTIDREAAAFTESACVCNRDQPWWPGDATRYENVRHVMPNHYLDVRRQTVHRFWPRAERSPVPLGEAVRQSADLLTGLICAAHRRFPLAVTVTAGFDSRAVLAATRPVRNDIYYLSYRWHARQLVDMADIVIPARLLQKLGLTHHVVDALAPSGSPDLSFNEFQDYYLENVTGARRVFAPLAYALNASAAGRMVIVKGHASEIGRCGYYSYGYPRHKIDGGMLAAKVGMRGNTYAAAKLGAWLDDVKDCAERFRYELFDLLYWEQRVGRGLALDQSEQDTVQDTFSPFNCRDLLTTLLAVPERHRKTTSNRLYVRLIRHLWRDVLSVPVRSTFRPALKTRIQHGVHALRARLEWR